VTAEEVIDAFIRSNEARKRQAANLYAKIQAARDAGMSDQQIRRSFDNTGISGRELSAIMRNKYIPLRPSRQIIREVMMEATGRTADVAAENRILQRLPVQDLNSIAREFQNQPLVSDRAPAPMFGEPVEQATPAPSPAPAAAPVMASPPSPLASPQTPPPTGQTSPSLRTNPIVLGYDRATQALAEYLSGR